MEITNRRILGHAWQRYRKSGKGPYRYDGFTSRYRRQAQGCDLMAKISIAGDPEEIPPATPPGHPAEPPPESPPGNPRPEVPPPVNDPVEPSRPNELPGHLPDELPGRGPKGPRTPNPNHANISGEGRQHFDFRL
jgi:hypothetical protein